MGTKLGFHDTLNLNWTKFSIGINKRQHLTPDNFNSANFWEIHLR